MKITMRMIAAMALTSALLVTGAAAAGNGPLAAGAPAGVKHAQEEDNTLLFIGLGVAAVAIAVAASSGGGHSNSAPTGTQ